jgi:hypothetical protein
MSVTQSEKAARFRELHDQPNGTSETLLGEFMQGHRESVAFSFKESY